MKNNYTIDTQKILFFQESILNWYKKYGRSFYWRTKGLSDYQYIIAEVLLQRTKAETVAKFYPSFIGRFPNWESLFEANILEIAELLKPIGLYTQRSVRLKKLAEEILRRKEHLPTNREDLESIPFIGQYIANAIELIIFNNPSPLLDVNMARVLERFFGSKKLADIRYDPYLQELSYKIVEHESAKEINWGILDFAAMVCKARGPKCGKCLLIKECQYYTINVGKLF